ncbi:hypothetical protein KSP39_PZI011378 [Platanthera zijinensis]|uniref:Zinc finger C3HC4 RING-type domain-containing protein n=1 Tax=Platanthera zijinensis TaxID=2320716 RepID=A0AAP0G636_9ASPA
MVNRKGAAFIPCGHTFCRACSRALVTSRGNLLITVNSCLLIPSSKRTEIMKTSIPVTENLPANEQRNWFSAKTNSSAS